MVKPQESTNLWAGCERSEVRFGRVERLHRTTSWTIRGEVRRRTGWYEFRFNASAVFWAR